MRGSAVWKNSENYKKMTWKSSEIIKNPKKWWNWMQKVWEKDKKSSSNKKLNKK